MFGPCCIHILFEPHQSLFGMRFRWQSLQSNHTWVHFNRTKAAKCEHTL